MSGAVPPDHALVLRFPPGGTDDVARIRKEAKYQHRHSRPEGWEGTWYRVSVWADAAKPGEPEHAHALMARLVHAAGLSGIRISDERNSLFWWTTVREVLDAGFTLVKDNEPGEADEHYSVDLGSDPSSEVVERLVAVFRGP